ncbi:MAG: hypothetical protein ABSE72_13105, partial [Bacteroidales bacterium]
MNKIDDILTDHKNFPRIRVWNDFYFSFFIFYFSFFIILFFLLPSITFAQLDAGPNDTINAGVPVTLTATYGDPGIPVILGDDDVEG